MKIFETFECSGQILSNSLCQFWNDKLIPLQILYPSSVSWKITFLYIFSPNNMYFAQKEPIKMKFLGLSKFIKFHKLGSKFIKFHKSILKWQVNSSSKFASFFIVMTRNFSGDFNLILSLLWIKGSHQNPNFETFNCSDENFPYSSCHFPNHKSVFLRILHHSSVSWKITPLYFFSSNIKYFAHFSL